MINKIQLNDNGGLERIKLSDYLYINKNLSEWLEIKEEIPNEFWEMIKNTNQELNLKLMIMRIKDIWLYDLYKGKNNTARSFYDSRFSSLSQMIKRKMATCGSSVKIIGIILRRFGIPVKFIHGITNSQKKSFIKRRIFIERHSWLEIYNPNKNEWIPVDLTEKDLNIRKDANRIKEYHDWDEMKKDYKKRDI